MKSDKRKAAEREAIVERMCSCIECGTIVRASPLPWDQALYGVFLDDALALRDIVGCEWELKQGFFKAFMHEWECPSMRGVAIEVDQAGASVRAAS
jgi:hypothetical protein